jgi:hypothetical protein
MDKVEALDINVFISSFYIYYIGYRITDSLALNFVRTLVDLGQEQLVSLDINVSYFILAHGIHWF